MLKAIQFLLHYLGLEIRKVENFTIKPNREIFIQIGKYSLKVNTRNPISIHYSKHPTYSSELARLAKEMFSKYPFMRVVDIGANIGDTTAILKNATDVPVVCIEGDPYCFGFLEQNIKQFSNTKAFKQFLGDKDETISAIVEKSEWNTTIIPGAESKGNNISLVTLDSFSKVFFPENEYKLLKIDTEGFDVKILRGASDFINRNHPAIYFEYNKHNMNAISEKGIDTLFALKDKGYNSILFYEDSSRFILSDRLSNTNTILQLDNWISGSTGVYYFDLILFHESDQELADQFIMKETEYLKSALSKK